jgi:hypothetical protein
MLEELIIPANIIAIGHYALKQFMKLSTITFEENSLLSVVGVGAFAMCLKLKEVDFSNCEQLSVLNGDIFVGSGVETVRLPDSLEVIHARAFEASNIKNVYAGGIKYTLQEFEKALKDNEYKNFWAVNYLDILNV